MQVRQDHWYIIELRRLSVGGDWRVFVECYGILKSCHRRENWWWNFAQTQTITKHTLKDPETWAIGGCSNPLNVGKTHPESTFRWPGFGLFLESTGGKKVFFTLTTFETQIKNTTRLNHWIEQFHVCFRVDDIETVRMTPNGPYFGVYLNFFSRFKVFHSWFFEYFTFFLLHFNQCIIETSPTPPVERQWYHDRYRSGQWHMPQLPSHLSIPFRNPVASACRPGLNK